LLTHSSGTQEADVSCACDAQHLLIPYVHVPEPQLYIVLVYKSGARFTFAVPPKDIGCICPYMKLDVFLYFPPVSSLAEYQEVTGSTVAEDSFVPWHGFGAGYAGTQP
jgi:hypothetical protein